MLLCVYDRTIKVRIDLRRSLYSPPVLSSVVPSAAGGRCRYRITDIFSILNEW
jgi:hypothetical protein